MSEHDLAASFEERIDALRREHVHASSATEAMLARMLELQQAEDARREASRQFILRYVVVPLVLALLGGGSAAAQYLSTIGTPKDAIDAAEGAAKSVGRDVTSRVQRAEEKIRLLGELAVEQQVQIADGFEYVADKIDAANPRTRDAVKEPDSLVKGREKADRIKRSARAEALFDAETDPLLRIATP